jgi:hypothetical protein
MNIEFLLSFKDHPELLLLNDSVIKSLPDNFVRIYSKKVKKKITKPISKSNILKNSKLQTAKNKDENKVNLVLNKLSEDNLNNIIQEFLETFVDVDQEKYDVILKTIYLKLIKDEKFIYIYYKLYNVINSIYFSLFDLNNKFFIDIIQNKVLSDYNVKKLKDTFKFVSKLKTEENRINNLKLIILLIESDNLNKEIITKVTDIIIKDDKIPDIVFWFNNKIIRKNIKLEDYYDILSSKLKNKINNRSRVLLKNLLNIEDNEILDDSDSSSDDEELSEFSDDSCVISVKEENTKSEFEIEIDNIIEEFLLLEDVDEILTFIKEFSKDKDSTKLFTKTLLNFYFNSTINNYSKFKILFINLKKSKLIDNDFYISSLSELMNDENKLDYNNLTKKLDKIIEIYRLIQINLNKEFINTLK